MSVQKLTAEHFAALTPVDIEERLSGLPSIRRARGLEWVFGRSSNVLVERSFWNALRKRLLKSRVARVGELDPTEVEQEWLPRLRTIEELRDY